MNLERAIQVLKKYHDSSLLQIHLDFLHNPSKYQTDGCPNEYICQSEDVRYAIDEAVVAMEKQIPQRIDCANPTHVKALDIDVMEVRTYECVPCPACNRWVAINITEKYCERCGQRLDWSVE